MYFTAVAEMELDTLKAMGEPPMKGRVLVFTPDDAEEALASVTEEWRESLPEADFWHEEAPEARWYGAFAPEPRGNFPEPPPNEGHRFALAWDGGTYPGVVLNETRAAGEPFHQRFLIAGDGDVPEPESAS